MVAWGETGVFARNSRLFGISGKHNLANADILYAVPAQMILTYSHILVVLVFFIRCHSRYSAS